MDKIILFFENSDTFGFIVIKSKMCKNEQTKVGKHFHKNTHWLRQKKALLNFIFEIVITWHKCQRRSTGFYVKKKTNVQNLVNVFTRKTYFLTTVENSKRNKNIRFVVFTLVPRSVCV